MTYNASIPVKMTHCEQAAVGRVWPCAWAPAPCCQRFLSLTKGPVSRSTCHY